VRLLFDETQAADVLLRQGNVDTLEVPPGITSFRITTNVLVGDPARAKMYLLGSSGESVDFVPDRPLDIISMEGVDYSIGLNCDTPIEMGVSIRPLYIEWNNTNRMRNSFNLILPDGMQHDLPLLDDLTGNVVIVAGNEEADRLFGVTVQSIESTTDGSAATLTDDTQESIDSASLAQPHTILYRDGDAVKAIMVYRANSNGDVQKVIVFTQDVFAGDAEQMDTMLRDTYEAYLQVLHISEPSQLDADAATWLNVALTISKRAAGAIILFGVTLVIALGALPMIAIAKKKRSVRSFFTPAQSGWVRVGQIALMWLAFGTLCGIVLALKIVSLEQSGLFLRTLIDRLKGLDAEGGEFCRKCVIIEDMPWIAVPFAIAGALSVIWIFWYRFIEVYIYARERYLEFIDRDSKRQHYHSYLERSLAVVVVWLPVLGASLSIVGGVSMLLLITVIFSPPMNERTLLFASLIDNRARNGNRRGIVIALMLLAPIVYLTQVANATWRPFANSIKAETYISDDSRLIPYQSDDQLPVVYGNTTQMLSFASPYARKIASSTVAFEMQGSGSISLLSEQLWGESTVRISSQLASFVHRYDYGRFALLTDTPLTAETLAGALRSFSPGDKIVVMADEDDTWLKDQQDYFSRSSYYTAEALTYSDGSYLYPLGLVGSTYTMYVYADRPFTFELAKQDFNQVAGDDILTISIENSTGEMVEFGAIDDDHEMLGTIGKLQSETIAVGGDDFVPGVFKVKLNPYEEQSILDYVVSSVRLSTPYIVIEGPVVLDAGSQLEVINDTAFAYIERLPTILFARTSLPCIEIEVWDRYEQRCVRAKQGIALDTIAAGTTIRSMGMVSRIATPFILYAPAPAATFSPYRYVWKSEIRNKVAAAIIDSAVRVQSNDEGWVSVRIEKPLAGSNFCSSKECSMRISSPESASSNFIRDITLTGNK
jgi:hypothetical protein